MSSNGLPPFCLTWLKLQVSVLDDKAKFLISEFQSHCSYLWLLHNPYPFFPVGLAHFRTVFLISCCSNCGIYVCPHHFGFRRKVNSPRGSVHVLVLLCFFSKTAFHLCCQIKGRKPQITIWMVGKDLSHSGNAFGRQAMQALLQERRRWRTVQFKLCVD